MTRLSLFSVALLLAFAACGSPAPKAKHLDVATPSPTATTRPASIPTATPRQVPPTTTAHAATGSTCRYVFPVRPPSSTHYTQYHHDYPATDIFAPRGTPVVSPVDGVVDYVSRKDTWDPKVNDGATRGGLSFAVIGKDGIRYYGSHMLDVAPAIVVGAHVTAGQAVGHVDTSGDARGIEPHLHFGISHPTTPTDWQVRRGEVNPYTYINAWRKGQNLTPVVPGSRAPSCTPAR